MTIYCYDGSKLDCTEIEFSGSNLIADEYYFVPLDDIVRITDN